MRCPVELLSRYALQHEYLLQGSIQDTNRDILLHRLNGLCDSRKAVPEKFLDHEMTFVLRPQQHRVVSLRVRRALHDGDDDNKLRYRHEGPVQLKYLAPPDTDRSKATLIRKNMEMGTSHSVEQFLMELGFKKEHEYIAKGYQFRKGRMQISVYKVFKLPSSDLSQMAPKTDSCLVELSVAGQHSQDQIQTEMRSFAQHLLPLVSLEKLTELNVLPQ